MRNACAAVKSAGKTLGFVPTMGALHEGHISLVRAAKKQCDVVVVSIFVNPTQFGPNEDLAKYPSKLDEDRAMLCEEGIDLLFTPTSEEMYPAGAMTFVEVGGLSERLCGKSRPGHFKGVATVVNKLFNIIRPDAAFFGQKDAAQCAVIKSMVRDLDMPVEIVVCPIVREADGLALSSRNAYLSMIERKQALVLWRALQEVLNHYQNSEFATDRLIHEARKILSMEPEVQLEYFEIVDAASLEPVDKASPGAVVAVAARVGGTRLIDNIPLS